MFSDDIPAFHADPGADKRKGKVQVGNAAMAVHFGSCVFRRDLVARFADRPCRPFHQHRHPALPPPPDQPLPADLVRDMVAARLAGIG